MGAADGTEPIDDEELLYRRIPKSQGWYDPALPCPVSPEAFGPQKHDEKGISVWRAKYRTLKEAAQGRPGKTYYVAVFRAGDLKEKGIEVTPTPHEGGPGHASIRGDDLRGSEDQQGVGAQADPGVPPVQAGLWLFSDPRASRVLMLGPCRGTYDWADLPADSP